MSYLSHAGIPPLIEKNTRVTLNEAAVIGNISDVRLRKKYRIERLVRVPRFYGVLHCTKIRNNRKQLQTCNLPQDC